jgi:DNA-binding response OmpR family regulator
MILVVSKDKDFSHTLAEHIVGQLGLECECVESAQAALRFAPGSVQAVVTSEAELDRADAPVVTVAPPIRLNELLRQIAQAAGEATAEDITFAGFRLSRREKRLAHNANSVDLTDKEIALLQAMLDAPAKGAAKEDLLKNIWGIEAEVNTHTLETHIYRLRAKFKDISGSEMILAEDGGYRISA